MPDAAAVLMEHLHPPRAVGVRIEQDRLELRAERVRKVVVALREQASTHASVAAVPEPLGAAIEHFSRELTALERQLRQSDAV